MRYEAERQCPLERADWEQREVYAHFGLAIYFCQVLETGLVNCLVLLHRARAERDMTRSEIDELFVELFGYTLGRNIKTLKRLLGKHGESLLAGQMAEILALRNELTHHWMRTRSMQQGTSENRLKMIDELRDAINKLEEADRVLRERTQTMMAEVGVPGEFVLKEFERLMELAERGEDDPSSPGYYSNS